MNRRRVVRLVPVDEQMLERLTAVAISDANSEEVTPPLTPDDRWSPRRIEWFKEYHRSRRAGLDGGAGEATWAILCEGEPVGAVRLQLTETEDELEAGIWLARTARGTGVAKDALRGVLDEARSRGAHTVRANTTTSNTKSQWMLRSAGFALAVPTADGHVRAVLRIARFADDVWG
ncbi:GNAT family N-acetyltransferase [Spelaeicoccus albus]|uniref:RimJ/RimL family protein N-acetyltransferase n=1 Tax=Spelaeicoccus albus TaxID=1280376 RepID=A0A7Z0D370_9MICO|nr:GNAT family N-acetyltransferase [Spelaeicoccus albus]NYI68036.1 RimJ/RimL family protein N-acetyltransferase [Spelaeicoccus albus]